ncbi:MAG: methyltransferase domain-containing protein [Sideroxydans sp.]|nr:methyltransferase domain-containing protein [Sideroxydans sp.]
MASFFPQQSDAEKARKILRHIFTGYNGSLAVRLGRDGETMTVGKSPPDCVLVFNRLKPLRDLILAPDPLRLADAHFRGWVDIEGNIYTALEMRDYLQSLKLPAVQKFSLWLTALTLPVATDEDSPGQKNRVWSKPLTMARHSKRMNREAIGFHYDVSNDFYRLWLDAQMVYSCAYFRHADDSLDDAQSSKLDLICRKLRLQPGERLLDIGCGWGALVIWAARHYGVTAHGITLSHNQYAYAVRRVRELGLDGQVTVELRDYRDLEGEGIYDKVSSVGMFEHVGLRNLPRYFTAVHRLLRDGGLFLNHGITQDEEGGTSTIGFRFINKYVFPDGELDWISNIQVVMERGAFEIHDVESLRAHYALTLRHWVGRLEAHHQEALAFVPEAVYRIWRMYMAGCARQFENGEMGVYQILAVKRNRRPLALPLTRSYLVTGGGA